MSWTWMRRVLRRSKQAAAVVCERCGRVCDAASRAAAIRERTIDNALRARL